MPSELPSTIISNCSDADTLAPTVRCQICRDIVAEATTVALRACGHRFCGSCLSAFLTIQIREGDVALPCFYWDETADTHPTCGVGIAEEDVKALVVPEIYSTFTRFLLIKSTAQARQCPFCDHAQVPLATAEAPACTCERCGRLFCFTHGNAHADSESCAQYEKRQSRGERRSGRVVSRISRPCPECARPIEKNGGCSHMTCQVCKTQFCWHCGMRWGFNYYYHFRSLHLESCDGIAEYMVLFMDSTKPWARFLAKAMYYTIMVTLAWPLTIALCWAWIPYTLYAENRAVPKRARVLARFIAIHTTIAITCLVTLVTIVIVDGSAWFAAKVFHGLRNLRQCICNRWWRSKTGARTTEKEDSSTNFAALHDAARLA